MKILLSLAVIVIGVLLAWTCQRWYETIWSGTIVDGDDHLSCRLVLRGQQLSVEVRDPSHAGRRTISAIDLPAETRESSLARIRSSSLRVEIKDRQLILKDNVGEIHRTPY